MGGQAHPAIVTGPMDVSLRESPAAAVLGQDRNISDFMTISDMNFLEFILAIRDQLDDTLEVWKCVPDWNTCLSTASLASFSPIPARPTNL